MDLNEANLLKHLQRHGPEGILQTAFDGGLGLTEMVRLQEAIDAWEQANVRRAPKRRRTAEQRVRSWLGLPEEEESPSAQ